MGRFHREMVPRSTKILNFFVIRVIFNSSGLDFNYTVLAADNLNFCHHQANTSNYELRFLFSSENIFLKSIRAVVDGLIRMVYC